MGYTVLTSALANENQFESGLLEIFARQNPLIRSMPVKTIRPQTFSFQYEREKSLPSTGFRAVNGNYTKSYYMTETKSAQINMFGGEFDIDTSKKNADEEARAYIQFAKSASAELQKYVFDGDASTGQFDGFNQITADESKRAVPNNAANGFQPLASAGNSRIFIETIQDKIQEVSGDLPAAVDSGDYSGLVIIMDALMLNLLNQSLVLAGYETTWKDAKTGALRQVAVFDGIPILLTTRDRSRNRILAFDETVGTNDNCGSLYIANIDEMAGVSFVSWGENNIVSPQWEMPTRSRNQWNYTFNIPIGLVARRSDSVYRIYGVRQGTS